MRSVIIGIFIAIIATGAQGQRPGSKSPSKATASVSKPQSTPTATPEPTPAPDPAAVEAQLFDAAHAASELSERVALLEKFVTGFPDSERLPEARESLMIARSSLAEERLEAGDISGGVALLKLTVTESPEDTPDGLFDEVIMKIPGNLYFRGRRDEAFEIASFIEKRFETNAARLVGLASFHLAIENGADAVRLANRAIEIDPASSAAYQTLGTAYRLNFDLDAASVAFLKAYELDQTSLSAKRGLADINRAVGRSDQAATLYKEILAESENDVPARAGYVLSLFEAGKRPQAETELAAALERNPKNLPLLAGVAYWFAVNKEGAKAIEYAQKAIALEPRYVWSHIALARGQIAEGKPVEAEKTLISARKYGNFPTMDYEIAVARLSAGFFRDAAEGLENSFIFENGEVSTKLGGRIARSNSDIVELIAAERQSSILAPRSADDRELAERFSTLKLLLDTLGSESPSPETAAVLTEKFVEGPDPMRVHRALFAASLLLEKKIAVEKAAELVTSLTGTTDVGLTVANPSSAVMAVELYGPRSLAASRGEFLLVPELPRQTLTAILRGRVEELAGWSLLEQGKPEEAAIRFKRAVSVLPENSAWWRAAKWRLGSSLALQGNEAEALEQYIAGYDKERPDIVKYIVVEALYRKLNNGTDGLEARIGPNPLPQSVPTTEEKKDAIEISAQSPASEETGETSPKPIESVRTTETAVAASPEPAKPETFPTPQIEPTPGSVASVKAEPTSEPVANEKTEPASEPAAKVKAEATPESTEGPKPEPASDLAASPKTEPAPEPVKPPTAETEKKPEITTESVQDPAPQKAEQVATKPEQETLKAVPETPKIEDVKAEEVITKESEPPKAIETTTAKTEVPVPEKSEEKIPAPVEPENQIPPKDADAKPVTEPEPKPSASEIETPKSEPPNEEKTEPPATQKLVVEKSEPTPPQISKEPEAANKAEETSRSLFEPIVITVPSTRPKIVRKPADEVAEEKSEKPEESESKRDDLAENASEAASREDKSGGRRPRVVVTNDLPCRIGVSQDNISLISGGGTIGVLVTVDEGTDVKALKAVSNSPDDIEVTPEPEISGVNGRAFFIIRSKSLNVGMYQVSFAAPCGKKDVMVQVR